MAEVISKVLYPSDNHPEGKALRLRQQYFLVSASVQDIVRHHLRVNGTLDNFSDRVAIHINDTHPAMCIPEMMRILMDEYGYTWDDAFNVVKKTLAYTNHTILAEALEKWPEDLLQRRLPRIWAIINELNQRFCGEHPAIRAEMPALVGERIRCFSLHYELQQRTRRFFPHS